MCRKQSIAIHRLENLKSLALEAEFAAKMDKEREPLWLSLAVALSPLIESLKEETRAELLEGELELPLKETCPKCGHPRYIGRECQFCIGYSFAK